MKDISNNYLHDISRVLIIWLSKLLVVAVFALFCWYFYGSSVMVHGSSMKETLNDEDSVLIDKIKYRFSTPERFDVIAFETETGISVKRIVGLPGENVRITSSGEIFINGKQVFCEYISTLTTPGIALDGLIVPQGAYFVLGDNPSFSDDSRYSSFGFIEYEQIVGKVWMCFYPLSDLGLIR